MERNNYQGAMQRPVNSGFSAVSTTTDVIKGIDLTGKIAIVTGGNTGIGLETVKTLANAGATVIVPARDVQKAERNLSGILNVEVEKMDFMDPTSIDAFARKFLISGRPLHLLINNAGIMWVPLQRDSRGIESQLATNYLGHYHLTARLFPALKQANGARVVNVSSLGHQFGGFDFDDPNFINREYETLAAYGQSKTATNLFAMELDARAKQFGIRAYSLNPGAIGDTELGRNATLEQFQQLGFVDANGNMYPELLAKLKTIPQGAATTVWCATSPMLNGIGGVYCEDVDVAKIATKETVGTSGVELYSLNEAAAYRLWKLSEELTGVRFDQLHSAFERADV